MANGTGIGATVILSDAAQAQGGKLYVLGGGWTRLRSGVPASMALGIVVHIPFDKTNQRLKLSVDLLTEDGDQVTVGPEKAVQAFGEFEVGRPPGVKQGETLNFPMVMTFNGLQLEEGGYVFECKIGEEAIARCPFRVG